MRLKPPCSSRAWRRQRTGISSDLDLGPLVDPTVPFDGNPVFLQRLTHMRRGEGLAESLADLPADLRCFESGAVTLPQLAAIYHATGATAASDIRMAIDDGSSGDSRSR
jgi:hypothetical protein